MTTIDDLETAREYLAFHGGVLLNIGGGCYGVCGTLAEAVEQREGCGSDSPLYVASYWAAMGEAGYDETKIQRDGDQWECITSDAARVRYTGSRALLTEAWKE